MYVYVYVYMCIAEVGLNNLYVNYFHMICVDVYIHTHIVFHMICVDVYAQTCILYISLRRVYIVCMYIIFIFVCACLSARLLVFRKEKNELIN
jgi:hypothetical protein